MSGPTLRRLALVDAAAAAALIRVSFADQGSASDPPSSALKETADAVANKLAEGGGFAFETDGALVALALFQPDVDALYLGRLAVAPAFRGQGLAQRLIVSAEQEAMRRGFAKLCLRVRLDLPANLRLFARCGFAEAARGAHDGYSQPTYAVMEKRLV